MICDICKKDNAVIHIQEIGPGGKHAINLCMKCAAKRFFGQGGTFLPGLDKILKGLQNPETMMGVMSQLEKHKGLLEALAPRSQQAKCPGCGRTWEDIKHTRQLGCEKCLDTFHEEAGNILETVNRVIWNTYEKNVKQQDDISLDDEDDIEKSVKQRDLQFEIERLNRELACAVKEENYERAARLRDLIAEFNPISLPEQSE